MRCTCGDLHQETLHKTPGDPDHFRQKVANDLDMLNSGRVTLCS